MENVKQTKTLIEYRAEILKEVGMVGDKPYSHNIIGCILQQVWEDFGSDESDTLIRQCGLDELGWKVKRT